MRLTLSNMSRRELGIGISLVAASLLFAVVSMSQKSSLDRIDFVVEGYGSIEDLARGADLVIVGTVGPIVDEEDDRGGDPEVDAESGERIPGTPMAFAEVTVDIVVVGAHPGASIVVGFVDPGRAVSDQSSPLVDGQHVLLYLENRDEKSAPGITVVDEHWVPMSGDNGVLDVVGAGASQTVQARSALPTDLTGQELSTSKPPLVAGLDIVLATTRATR